MLHMWRDRKSVPSLRPRFKSFVHILRARQTRQPPFPVDFKFQRPAAAAATQKPTHDALEMLKVLQLVQQIDVGKK